MNSREKTIVMRVLFVILVLALTAGLVALVTVLNTDASYPVPLEPGVQAVPEDADSPLEVSEMPEDAYMPVRLTFAGSCTPGSMLGSDSYGTFNELFASEGSTYFLEPLREIFLADDVTVSVCDAVLSDAAERTPAARGAAAWYRGPADAARIFADGGVDVLSLHAYHTWDYGADGYNDTAAALENAGLAWCDHGKAFYYEKEGITAALYCRYADDESDSEAVLAWLENAENYNKIEKEIKLKEKIEAPVKKGDILGKITYKIDGVVLGENSIIAKENVEEITFFGFLAEVFKNFISI